MADKSNIEWTDATWNPVVGCSIVSPGCTNCYAMQMAARIESMSEARRPGGTLGPMTHYYGTTKRVNGNAVWNGKVALAPDNILTAPLRWKRPRKIFVNSMGDLFHEAIPDEWIDRVFAVMALCPQHTFQVLTKRAERLRDYCLALPSRSVAVAQAAVWLGVWDDPDGIAVTVNDLIDRPLPNVWLGVSCERQHEWDERKEHLRNTPAAVHFASFEPLLGAVIEPRPMSDFIQWGIVGGESGPKARPMHPQWARDIQDQCEAAGVAFFMKQWGEWLPWSQFVYANNVHDDPEQTKFATREWGNNKWTDVGRPMWCDTADGNIDDQQCVARVGKKAAGRLLDGVEYNSFPKVSA